MSLKEKHKFVTKLMGCRFELCITGNDINLMCKSMEDVVSEIALLEQLLTTYSEESDTNLINRNAGIRPVKVHPKVFDLIEYSIFISKISNGAFDITYGSCYDEFWNFDTSMSSLPENNDSIIIKDRINYKNILLNKKEQTVFLKEKNTKIGFGGIGKGFAADHAMELFKQAGFNDGYINASGDIRAWGHAPEKDHWTIGIKNPFQHDEVLIDMQIYDGAIATSGNYERFAKINDQLYSHTIDPNTGYPLPGVTSVTVTAENATYADALATVVGILGIKEGLTFINKLKNVGCFIVDQHNQFHLSANFRNKVCYS